MSLGGPDPLVWNRLAEAAGNIFGTHTWAECWWREYGDDHTPSVICDDPVDPRVILPLYRTGRGLRQVRFIGNGPADQLGPVCRPEDSHLAVDLLREALADSRLTGDVVLLQDMPSARPWWEPLSARRIRLEKSPVLRFDQPMTWEELLASKSKNFRGQATGKPRRLARRHAVAYRMATPGSLEEDLEQFFALHATRWEGSSSILEERKRRFLSDFARAADERGWLRLWFVELDGRPVASFLGFQFAGAYYYYQAGRDLAVEDTSVGFVLLVHVIRDALESGASEFRLLRGDESYKARFATGHADIETVAFPVSVRGRLVTAAARLARRNER